MGIRLRCTLRTRSMHSECSYLYNGPSFSFSTCPPPLARFRSPQVAGCPCIVLRCCRPRLCVNAQPRAERSSIPLDLLCDPDSSRCISRPAVRHNNDPLRIHSIRGPRASVGVSIGAKSAAAMLSRSKHSDSLRKCRGSGAHSSALNMELSRGPPASTKCSFNILREGDSFVKVLCGC